MKKIEKLLYSNIGQKIKMLSLITGIIGMLGIVVGVILFLAGIDAYELMIVGSIVAGSGLVLWVSTWPLYAFGQITEDGYYDTAIDYLTELDDYKDSKELLKKVKAAKKEAEYQEALGMLEKGRYWNDDAMDAFEGLGDYKDSVDRLADCQHREAIKDLNFDYFKKNCESYTGVKGSETVNAVTGSKYTIREYYSGVLRIGICNICKRITIL